MDGKLELILQKLESGEQLSDREIQAAFEEIIRMGAIMNSLIENNLMVRLGSINLKNLIFGFVIAVFMANIISSLIINVFGIETFVLEQFMGLIK